MRASWSRRCSRVGWEESSRLQALLGGEGGHEVEGVVRLGLPQVLRGDPGHLATHLGQGGGEGRGAAGEQGGRAVRGELAVAGQQPRQQEAQGVDDCADQRDEHDDDPRRIVSPAVAGESAPQGDPRHDPGEDPEERGDGHHGHVPVRDVRHLVGEDAFEFLGLQSAQEPGRGADEGRSLAAAGREGVRHVAPRDRDPGFGHVGQGADPVDRTVQLRRFLRGDLPGAHPVGRDAVAEPELGDEEAARDDQDDRPGAPQDGEEHAHEHDVQQPDEEHRAHHAGGQPSVRGVAGTGSCHGCLQRLACHLHPIMLLSRTNRTGAGARVRTAHGQRSSRVQSSPSRR